MARRGRKSFEPVSTTRSPRMGDLTVGDYANGMPNIRLGEMFKSFMRQLVWILPLLIIGFLIAGYLTKDLKRVYSGDASILVQLGEEYVYNPVGPDGRVVMPMSRPIMAAGRTFGQVQNELTGELGKQLRDPTIAVTPRAYAPEQIYVGGQVGQPGTYTLPGRIGAIEAIFMAGGFDQGARAKQVAVLRRAPNGAMMMRPVNIQGGIRNIREYNDNIQLRRGDIIFVPKTNLAEVGAFVQAIRQTFPVDFNLSYQFGSNDGGTTVLTP